MKNTTTLFLLKSLAMLFVQNFLFAQPGSNDPAFNPGTGFDNQIYSTAIQSDGKIIVGGNFTSYNGTARNCIARLNVDGSLDTGFNSGTGFNSHVWSTALQPDGKIIVGGYFTSYNGTTINRIARLNADGSLDTGFNPGTSFNSTLYSTAIQPDGKIIVGGYFTSFNGTTTNRIARLNADGSLDTGFNPGTGFNWYVYSTVIQPDGKIIVGGQFTSVNGTTINSIARLNPDGSLDTGFNPGTGFNGAVLSTALQPDGKIIVGGRFTSFNGTTTNRIVRLNPDGSLDAGFNSGIGFSYFVWSITLQPDGKIIVGGEFTSYNGTERKYIARLNPNGGLDTGFNPGTIFNNYVRSTAIQSDGEIIVGGYFTFFNGTGRNRIARLFGFPVGYNTIRGNIYTDNNNDCQFQSTENPLPSFLVKALPGSYYGGSDANGHYQVIVDSGAVAYTLAQQLNSINSKLIVNQCASSHNVSLTGASKDTCCFNFADSIKSCALLNISVQNTRMRRCFRNNSYVNYCNYGNIVSSSTQVSVEYPSYIVPISSIPAWTSKSGNVLNFDIGTLAANACGRITITDSVICGDESITGLTQCIKATISPASNCSAEDPAWDRSSMNVTGTCNNDNAVFTIRNAGSGNMADSLEYRVYMNDTLIFTGNYKLNSGESYTVTYPAQGNTIRLEADQHPLHPGKSHPRAIIENCGIAAPEVRNLVITAPQDDLDEETAITCNIIRNSCDPNDKQTMPEGIGATNIVAPGTELEYTIRFQNTGTDTAYTVRVIDTLDIALEAGSFTQGASSHPYTLNISGKNQAVLAFNFYNINLPDSTTDKSGSNGLVSFRIAVPASTTLGTEIKNKAHIFFDYNSAIITNETMHTVEVSVPADLAKGSLVQVGQVITGLNKRFTGSVKIYPNPTHGILTVEIPEQNNNSELRIISVLGVLQKSVRLNNATKQEVNLEGIKEGMYLYEILMDGERTSGGLLLVR
jgi:uncharacterized delta-60 repeat protein/uncharacterized repeat protein (TIGR01451 family)